VRLEAAAARMRDQMQGFQHEVDFTEQIKNATASVAGLDPVEALLRFVGLRCVEAKGLREVTLKEMQDHPLQGLMPTKIFDGRGRLVEQAPSALGDAAE
jgi:hypothetical protein